MRVADAPQQAVKCLDDAALKQRCDGMVAQAQSLQIPGRAGQPATQQAAAHGGDGAVHHLRQCVLCAARQILVNLQVATGGRVQHDAVLAPIDAYRADMGESDTLGVFRVLQQAAGSCDSGG